MEKKLTEQLLYDFYGELLTEKQQKILDYYYNDDYSLAEIAGLTGISRQGVYDVIKRARTVMGSYESKLGLCQRFEINQKRIETATAEISALINGLNNLSEKSLKAELTKILQQLVAIGDDY